MSKLDELSNVDGGWLALATELERLGSLGHGAFGHLRQRRLGLRLRARCWVLLSRGARSTYALATELSSTGVVLDFAKGSSSWRSPRTSA